MAEIILPLDIQELINKFFVDFVRKSDARNSLLKEINELKYCGIFRYHQRVFRSVPQEMLLLNCSSNQLYDFNQQDPNVVLTEWDFSENILSNPLAFLQDD